MPRVKSSPSGVGRGRVTAIVAPCAFFDGREISVSLEAERYIGVATFPTTPTVAVTVSPGKDRDMTRPITIHLDAMSALTVALALKRAAEALAPGAPGIE